MAFLLILAVSVSFNERINTPDIEIISTSVMPQLTVRQSVKLAEPLKTELLP